MLFYILLILLAIFLLKDMIDVKIMILAGVLLLVLMNRSNNPAKKMVKFANLENNTESSQEVVFSKYVIRNRLFILNSILASIINLKLDGQMRDFVNKLETEIKELKKQYKNTNLVEMNVEADDNRLIYQYHQKIVSEYLKNLKGLKTDRDDVKKTITQYNNRINKIKQWYKSTMEPTERKLDSVYEDEKAKLAKKYGGVADEEYVFGSRTTDVINEDLQNADMINDAVSNTYFEDKYQ